MMRMLWVMMVMFVPFVAPSLTLKRCLCVTSVLSWGSLGHLILRAFPRGVLGGSSGGT